jgi:hypothetical protein
VVQAANYVLDNGSISWVLNASDGTEPRDNWFANEFTAVAGANLITRVDFEVFTTAPNSAGMVVIYRVTDPGGNPALGASRIYTQAFPLLTGDGANLFMQQVNLTQPVLLNVGDKFLVAVFIANVIALPPNDKYPYLLDASGSATGTYWDRSTPNTFNLDDLSGAEPINQNLAGGTWNPGPGHVFIRAYASAGATPPLLVGPVSLGNGTFQFAFSNNTPGASFTLLTTTNLALPLSNWTVAGTPTNTAPGLFQFSIQATNGPQGFYRVRSP